MARPGSVAKGSEPIRVPGGKRMKEKAEFIRQIAEFLVGNEATKSIILESETRGNAGPIRWGHEWAKLRNRSPIRGYATVEEAERDLWEMLG